MKTHRYNRIVVFCTFIFMCNALEDSGGERCVKPSNVCVLDTNSNLVLNSVHSDNHVTESAHSDSHVLDSVHSDNHVGKSAHSDSHVLKSEYSDNHAAKSVHSDNHVTESAHSDSHVLKSEYSDNHVAKSVHSDNHVLNSVHSDNHVTESAHSDNHVLKSEYSDNHVTESAHSDSHVLKSEYSDNHAAKSVHSDNHVTESAHSDSHVLKSEYSDNHAAKSVHSDNHVTESAHSDSHVLKSEYSDNHAAKSVHSDSHVMESAHSDNHVLKSGYSDNHMDKSVLSSEHRYLAGIIAESLKVFAPVSTEIGNDLCRNHSLLFEDGVDNNKMWALRMFDASSKLPSGILAGNVVQLGNYDECLAVEDVDSEFGTFSGQHCMVTIGERTFFNEIDLLSKKALGFETKRIPDDDNTFESAQALLSSVSMLWSVCVPSSCGPRDVEQHLRSVLRTRLGGVLINVQDGACNSKANKTPLRTSDWCVVAFLSFLGILVIVSTSHDLTTWKSSSRKELLLSFSLELHRRRLVRVDPPTVNDLPVINGVKSISMMWIILLHYSMFTMFYPAINHTVIAQCLSNFSWISTLVTNGSLAVDSFFLVSGLLMCFNFLKDRENGIEFSLPHYYVHRYIRITPLYAVLQMLMATLYTADGLFEGPYWRHNAGVVRSKCENWFHTMLFFNNVLPPEDMCLGHTWYLSVDMQLFLLSPLVLYPLWRRPLLGKCLVCFFTFLGAAISVGVSYVNKFQANIIPDSGEMGTKLYYPTLTRYTPWMIGIGLGYILHVTKRVSTPRLARSSVTLGWILSLTLVVGSLVSLHHFLQPGYRYDRPTSSLYLGLMRPLWALGVAWLVFALSRGYGARCLTNFYSCRFFQVVSRLSYSVYLTHIFVMLGFFANVKTPTHHSTATIVPKFLSDTMLSLACGYIVHVLFEAPPIYIERLMFGKVKRKSQKEE